MVSKKLQGSRKICRCHLWILWSRHKLVH
jgi:hypothetical protein